MREISDFTFSCDIDILTGEREEPEPIPDVPPPNKYWRSFEYTDGCSTLYYRGNPIPHIHLNGEFFHAQYKCREGYLLITGDKFFLLNRRRPVRESVTVGYLREDFSGMHWGSLVTRWKCLKDPRNRGVNESELDTNPIRNLKVEDEDRLVLTFRGDERYRITVYSPPKRFLCTFDYGANNFGPFWYHRRNLCINRVFW